MSILSKLDVDLQLKKDKNEVEVDRLYGWDIDVADTWYEYCPRSLADKDAFYQDSSWRHF